LIAVPDLFESYLGFRSHPGSAGISTGHDNHWNTNTHSARSPVPVGSEPSGRAKCQSKSLIRYSGPSTGIGQRLTRRTPCACFGTGGTTFKVG
jgi:hypothetical protein